MSAEEVRIRATSALAVSVLERLVVRSGECASTDVIVLRRASSVAYPAILLRLLPESASSLFRQPQRAEQTPSRAALPLSNRCRSGGPETVSSYRPAGANALDVAEAYVPGLPLASEIENRTGETRPSHIVPQTIADAPPSGGTHDP